MLMAYSDSQGVPAALAFGSTSRPLTYALGDPHSWSFRFGLVADHGGPYLRVDASSHDPLYQRHAAGVGACSTSAPRSPGRHLWSATADGMLPPRARVVAETRTLEQHRGGTPPLGPPPQTTANPWVPRPSRGYGPLDSSTTVPAKLGPHQQGSQSPTAQRLPIGQLRSGGSGWARRLRNDSGSFDLAVLIDRFAVSASSWSRWVRCLGPSSGSPWP